MDISNLSKPVGAGKQTKRSRWQAYIDDALMKTGQVTQAAIHGFDGLAWASSPHFQVAPEQVTKLFACITGDDASLRRNGIKVATQSYIFLRKEHGQSVYGRRGANAGVCIVKSKKSIIIGTYSAGMQPGNCNSVIEKLADYLLQHDL